MTWEEYKIKHEKLMEEECAKSWRFRWWYRINQFWFRVTNQLIRIGWYKLLNRIGLYDLLDWIEDRKLDNNDA